MRNNLYFVLFTVPLQTAVALWLAIVVNNRFLRARGFFRTVSCFPSVTGSVAITVVFTSLFQSSGALNPLPRYVGITGPNWPSDTRGVFTLILGALGVHGAPGWASGRFLLRAPPGPRVRPGAAIAFVPCLLIVVLTVVQRRFVKEDLTK